MQVVGMFPNIDGIPRKWQMTGFRENSYGFKLFRLKSWEHIGMTIEILYSKLKLNVRLFEIVPLINKSSNVFHLFPKKKKKKATGNF